MVSTPAGNLLNQMLIMVGLWLLCLQYIATMRQMSLSDHVLVLHSWW